MLYSFLIYVLEILRILQMGVKTEMKLCIKGLFRMMDPVFISILLACVFVLGNCIH